ncbi:hypothetical protein D3C78_1722970 [compost metagenome]
MLQERLPGFAQRHPAGAAIEQSGLQAFFQTGDLPADMRRGNPQALGGGGELAGLGYGDEFVESFPSVHRDYP